MATTKDITERLRADLELAAKTLRRYQELHITKGTPESLGKASANAALADRFEATLAATIEAQAACDAAMPVVATWRERVKHLDGPTDFADRCAAVEEARDLRWALTDAYARIAPMRTEWGAEVTALTERAEKARDPAVVPASCAECGKKSTPGCMWALYCVECIEQKVMPYLAGVPAESAPIDMVLHCPNCGKQHIDEADAPITVLEAVLRANPLAMPAPARWTNPPHRSHQCHYCKGADGMPFVWRPADVLTNGVSAVKTRGKADSPAQAPRDTAAMLAEHRLLVTEVGRAGWACDSARLRVAEIAIEASARKLLGEA